MTLSHQKSWLHSSVFSFNAAIKRIPQGLAINFAVTAKALRRQKFIRRLLRSAAIDFTSLLISRTFRWNRWNDKIGRWVRCNKGRRRTSKWATTNEETFRSSFFHIQTEIAAPTTSLTTELTHF